MTAGFRPIVLWSILGLAIAGGLAWSFRPQSVPAVVVAVTRGTMRVETSEEGRTRVQERYQVSAPLAGTLLRVEGSSGDRVEAGKTVLATLLPSAPGFLDVRTQAQAESAIKSAQAARDLAVAELRRTQAELTFAASDLRRAQALSKKEAISLASLDRARLGYNTSLAAVASAQAALEAKTYDLQTAKAQLIGPDSTDARTTRRLVIPLVAPVSGRILRILRESESVVAAGMPIMEIGDPTDLEVVVELLSEEAVKVHAGAPATLSDWGGAGILNARVRRVEPSGFTKISALGVEEQRVNVILDFTDRPAKWSSLADGFRVIAHIVIWQGNDVTQVPLTATFRTNIGWSVFAVRGGRAMLTPIKVGHSNSDFAEVLAGLRPGDRVVAHPSDRIRDGTHLSF